VTRWFENKIAQFYGKSSQKVAKKCWNFCIKAQFETCRLHVLPIGVLPMLLVLGSPILNLHLRSQNTPQV
jgi:hypothetical protein